MFSKEQLNIITPEQSERAVLEIGDIWYMMRDMSTREYDIVLVREHEREAGTPFTYVDLLSLTHGDSISIRTVDACVWTGIVWPMKVG